VPVPLSACVCEREKETILFRGVSVSNNSVLSDRKEKEEKTRAKSNKEKRVQKCLECRMSVSEVFEGAQSIEH
jgi:hypothetical protein